MIIRFADFRDEENIYVLSNEAEVRKNSFNTCAIPYNDHRVWFQNQIKNKNMIFLVAYEDEMLVGQIRLTIIDKEAIISVSISSKYRGKGYGLKMMAEAIKLIREMNNILIVSAYIKDENLVSKKYFEKCGFKFTKKKIHKGSITDIYSIDMFDNKS